MNSYMTLGDTEAMTPASLAPTPHWIYWVGALASLTSAMILISRRNRK